MNLFFTHFIQLIFSVHSALTYQFFAFHFADQKPVQLDENVDDEEAEPKVVKDDAKIQVHNILGKVKVH